MPNLALAHVVFAIRFYSEEDAERKLMEVQELVESVSDIDEVVGEFYPGD